jgi:hypothetical protein
MIRIPLQIIRRELALRQEIKNRLPLRILTNAAEKPNRTIQAVNVISEIKRRTAQAAPLREYVEQNFTDGKNQNQRPFKKGSGKCISPGRQSEAM